MIPGAADAIQSQLTTGLLAGEAAANYTAPAYDTLTNSNGAGFFPLAKQIYFSGGGHGGWPGNEVYCIDLESMTWNRQTDPSPMARNADGTWRTLDGTPISTHTYNGVCAVEAHQCVYFLIGSPWPLGNFITDLWRFDVNTSVWTHLLTRPLNRGGVPHCLWVESEQKLALGVPGWWRWYDPIADSLGPVQNSFQSALYGDNGMSVTTPDGIYSFHNGAMYLLDHADVGTVRPTNITSQYAAWAAFDGWEEVLDGWNTYAYDPQRGMVISWTGANMHSGDGSRIFAMDFANGSLYEFPLTGTYPPGIGVGAFSKLFYISELDCYFMLNNRADSNGWMVVKPGAMNLVAQV